jgi:hypothetical protein
MPVRVGGTSFPLPPKAVTRLDNCSILRAVRTKAEKRDLAAFVDAVPVLTERPGCRGRAGSGRWCRVGNRCRLCLPHPEEHADLLGRLCYADQAHAGEGEVVHRCAAGGRGQQAQLRVLAGGVRKVLERIAAGGDTAVRAASFSAGVRLSTHCEVLSQ